MFTVASAEPTPAELIERGRHELDNLDYDAAALDLTMASGDARATKDERITAHLYAGIAQRVLGHDTEARLHFLYVQRHAPDVKLPDGTPPKIQSFWDLVHSEIAGDEEPPPPAPPPRAPPTPTPTTTATTETPAPATTTTTTTATATPALATILLAGGG